MNRNERLRRLDIMYQNARDSLLLEKVRGHLIKWRNNFMRLERLVESEDDYRERDEDVFQTFFRSVVNDCLDFQMAHLDETDVALVETLIHFEEELSHHIFYTVADMEHNTEDLCDAILFLAAYESLSYIIDFIDDMISSIERR